MATAIVGTSPTAQAEDQRRTTVGMPARIDQIILPGSELEVRPLEDTRMPIVMRITASFRHGTDYRYDIVYYGLEPGKFNLEDYLKRKDGSSTGDLPSITVDIRPVLPPGQVEPNPLESKSAPFLGGYRTLLVLGSFVWLLGLFAILFVCRRKKGAAASGDDQPLSLADRLRPIVEDAIAGQITQVQQADLERMLLAYWRKRLDLENMKAAEAIVAIRDHEEAGGLLRQLEIWLHRPGSADEVDVAALLKPYQNLPANVLEPTHS